MKLSTTRELRSKLSSLRKSSSTTDFQGRDALEHAMDITRQHRKNHCLAIPVLPSQEFVLSKQTFAQVKKLLISFCRNWVIVKIFSNHCVEELIQNP